MRRRKALAEHPFGTLKCRAGYRHFLVRGFDKVRGEWSLMALCYNFSRVLRIIGLGPWMARLAQRAAEPLYRLVLALLPACYRVSRHAAALRPASRTPFPVPADRPPIETLHYNILAANFLAQPLPLFHPTLAVECIRPWELYAAAKYRSPLPRYRRRRPLRLHLAR